MMVEDRDLFRELKNGNENALNLVIDKYGNLIYKVAFQYFKSSELSKECINDTLLKIQNSIERYDSEKSSFIKWLTSITKYKAIDILRKEKRHYSKISLDEKINSTFDDIEDSYIKREELILTENTVRLRIFRVRKKLKLLVLEDSEMG